VLLLRSHFNPHSETSDFHPDGDVGNNSNNNNTIVQLTQRTGKGIKRKKEKRKITIVICQTACWV